MSGLSPCLPFDFWKIDSISACMSGLFACTLDDGLHLLVVSGVEYLFEGNQDRPSPSTFVQSLAAMLILNPNAPASLSLRCLARRKVKAKGRMRKPYEQKLYLVPSSVPPRTG
jgi:hypothetical protein